MNAEIDARDAARERLFDAVLEEAVAAECVSAHAEVRTRWGLVAAVLLATIVTFAVALSHAAGGAGEAQEPEPFDALFPRMELRFHRDRLHEQLRSVERVRGLPAGVLPPVAVLPGGPTGEGPVPVDVLDALLARDGVRSLTVAGDGGLSIERWRAIAALPELDELTIECDVDAESLRVLRHAPSLRALGLGKPRSELTVAMVEAVVELPHLDSIWLLWLDVAPGALQKLAGLPNLRCLWLDGCEVASGWIDELVRIRTLRWLGLVPGRFENGTLTADQLRRLADLPRLESLSLHRVDIAAADFAALPASLHTVQLGIEVPAAALRELIARPALRGLDVLGLDDEATAVLCESLPRTRLERFGSYGGISPKLWQALRGLPRLRRLSFGVSRNLTSDLAQVVKLEQLEQLSLATSIPPAEQLRCLRKLRHLRRLVISGVGDGSQFHADLAALQRAIGPAVDLIVR